MCEGSVYTVSSFGVEVLVWPLSLLTLALVVDVVNKSNQLPPSQVNMRVALLVVLVCLLRDLDYQHYR